MNFAKGFAIWFGVLSAIVGLYLAAAEQDLEVAFWIVIAGSIIMAAFPAFRRVATKAVISFRAYDPLLAKVGALSKELEQEQEDRQDLEQAVDKAYAAGIEEGEMRVLGSVLASESSVPPAIVGLAEINGSLVLVARYESDEEVREGARYDLQFAETEDSKGIVQVDQVDLEARKVHLICVERRSEPFWDHLEKRVGVDQSPPPGCSLFPYMYESPLAYDPLAEVSEASSEGDVDEY